MVPPTMEQPTAKFVSAALAVVESMRTMARRLHLMMEEVFMVFS